MRALIKGFMTLHPILFGVYFVLALYENNWVKVPVEHIYLPLIIVGGFCLLLLLLLRVIMRSWEKASLAASLTVVMFFTYDHLSNTAAANDWTIPAGWFALLILGLIFLAKTRTRALLVFSTIAATTLALTPVVTIVNHNLEQHGFEQHFEFAAPSGEHNTPDIYYIIVDKYAGLRTLSGHYAFENSELVNFLDDRGFYIAHESYANYSTTGHSLASSLNLNYIYPSDRSQLPSLLQDHMVWQYLESLGYEYVQVGCRNFWTENNEYADVNYLRSSENMATEFLDALYKTTPVYALTKWRLRALDYRVVHWRDVQYQFDVISHVPSILGATFTFAHILSPHHPFVFGQDGSFQDKETLPEDRNWDERYLDQLIYINKRLMQLVDEIIENSDGSPIIIIQSDEGTRTEHYLDIAESGKYTDWFDNPTADVLAVARSRFDILNAYYLPNSSNMLYPTITPVNSFRVIFNEYFDGNFALLPDECYQECWRSPVTYVNVTNLLRVGT